MEWTIDELFHLPWVSPPSVAVRVDMSVRPTPDEVVREIPPARSLQQTQTSPRQFPGHHHSPLPADRLRGESLVCKREHTTLQKRQDGSVFALTYSRRLRSCRAMGAFIISPMPFLLVPTSMCSKAPSLHGHYPRTVQIFELSEIIGEKRLGWPWQFRAELEQRRAYYEVLTLSPT
jgi:hypothetical protein